MVPSQPDHEFEWFGSHVWLALFQIHTTLNKHDQNNALPYSKIFLICFWVETLF